MNARPRCLLSFTVLILATVLSGALYRAFAVCRSEVVLTWPVEGDKAGQATIWGRYPDSGFGSALAVGDVNGDGFDDLIVGARFASPIVQAGGEVYVVPGPLALNASYTMPYGAALVFQGASGYQPQIGTYLDAGDINGDSLDDIAIGSWTSGYGYIYLGSPAIQASSPATVPVGAPDMALTIYPAHDGLAFCDFNADGYEDLFAEEFSAEDGVQVWGVLGSTAFTTTIPTSLTMPSDANVVIQGFHPTAWAAPVGENIACGDIDGDGTPDLAIGIWGEGLGPREEAGTVYVVRGDPAITYTSKVTITMPDQAGAIIDGTDGSTDLQPGDHLGLSLSVADVDRDGCADLIMAAPDAAGPGNLIPGAGGVYLWLGRALEGQRFTISGQASWVAHGDAPLEHLALALGTGDFDDDSYPEIVFGCTGCAIGGPPSYIAGIAYLLEPMQISSVASAASSACLAVVPYEDARGLGQSVAAMDVDADGVSDLLISAPGWVGQERPGTVYVISYPMRRRCFLPAVYR